ncbi:alpha/beta-hydrolase family protein [Gordonia aurantiaca]|uniref:alpha/beta-hydrolase family protein n=1 Tax=Gordonia sp. B21 TaxID=3151852 RepID=UPI0032646563
MNSSPRPVLVVCVLIGYLISLYPGSLPRDAVTMTVLTTAFASLGAIIGKWLSSRSACDVDDRSRRVSLGVGVLVAASGAGLAVRWQSLIRDAVGAPPVDILWCAGTTLAPAAAVAAIVLLPRLTAVVAACAVALTAGLLTPAQAGADGELPSPARTTSEPGLVLKGELSDGDFDRAATDLVDTWAHSGGLSADAVIVAVPTGSGWVDRTAVDGFVRRLGHDIRVLSLPYSDVPSWQAFVTDRSAATESAVALLRRLAPVLAAAPDRPRLVLYGQSLGAIGADAARVWLENHHPALPMETVLTAPPGGTVEDGSRTPRRILANHSDPVGRWSTTALWWPTTSPHGTVFDGPRVPEAPWLPVVSFLQTSVDLLSALDGPPGVGHRYGVEQVG